VGELGDAALHRPPQIEAALAFAMLCHQPAFLLPIDVLP